MARGFALLLAALSAVSGRAAAPEFDVCVVGAGAAGVPAALQAARAGARVVLLEQGFQPGGTMTSGGIAFPGLFHAWGRQVVDGVGYELVTNAVALAGGRLPDFSRPCGAQHWLHQIPMEPWAFAAVADEALLKDGVDVRYFTAPLSVDREAGLWRVRFAQCGDEGSLCARVLVDATGNGTVCAKAGFARMREEGPRQPGSYVYRLDPGRDVSSLDRDDLHRRFEKAVDDGILKRTDCRIPFADFLMRGGGEMNYVPDADNATGAGRSALVKKGRASMLRMLRFVRTLPGCEKARIVSAAPEVGVRETYRVLGETVITGEDYVTARSWPDGVCHAFYPIDLHDAKDGVRPRQQVEGRVAVVPFSALIPRGSTNLLVVGRCISSDRTANSALRVQATCMATGQVAGEAAALAVARGCAVRDVPLDELRARLAATGAVVPGCATDCLSKWPEGRAPETVGRRLVERFLERTPDAWSAHWYPWTKDAAMHYAIPCAWFGAFLFAEATEDGALSARLAKLYADGYLPDGPRACCVPEPVHVDLTMFGCLPLAVYCRTGNAAARAQGLAMADAQWVEPQKGAPAFNGMADYEGQVAWWKAGYTPQTRLWMDDMFMITVVQLQAFRATGERRYAERAAREMVLYLDRLQNPDGLFFHSPEAPYVWSRGNGWMAAGMAMLLRSLPGDDPSRARILDGYRRMMAALIAKQRPDGMWGQLADDPSTWAETSGTAMFAYAFVEGVKRGWLSDPAYARAARRAFLALTDHLTPEGDVTDCCEGTNAKNDRTHYLNRRRMTGDFHAQAPFLWCCAALARPPALKEYDGTKMDIARGEPELVNRPADGFRGIWYFNQKLGGEYVYKYSGGMGVYCAGHIPMGVYSPEKNRTYFCFGGTDAGNTTLLQSVSYFDHTTGLLARPTVVYDKHTTDAHDNAVIGLDDRGYIFVFSSSHGTVRPSAIARSVRPHDISEFETVWQGNFSYPQPFFVPGTGFLFIHTSYDNWRRDNYVSVFDPVAGKIGERKRLVFINEGNYLRSWQADDGRVGVVFDQHPKGKGLNWRTDLYYVETRDGGKTWCTAAGEQVKLPLETRENPALVARYAEKGLNVYIKGVKFDRDNRPILLYLVSKGYASGPENGPREWKIARFDGRAWTEYETGIASDNNYDFATLFVGENDELRIVGASDRGPQPYNPGGELSAWLSKDGGKTWCRERRLTQASVRNQNYPRQPLGVQDGFYAFWADGHGRRPSVSNLYFCDRELKVFRVPSAFDGAFARPEPMR